MINENADRVKMMVGVDVRMMVDAAPYI